MPDTTVLVVEDDETLRGTMVHLFEEEGYQARGVADGWEGLLALLAAERPLVVLLDLLLPSLTGEALLRVVLYTPTLQQHAYIVYTAAETAVTPAVRSLLDSLGVPLIAKPFDLEALVRESHEALHRMALSGP